MENIEIDGFLCPITHEIFKDPVMTCDGITYERKAIEQWFQKGKVSSPMTGMPLPAPTLTPNVALKKVIEESCLEISGMTKKVLELEGEVRTFQEEKERRERKRKFSQEDEILVAKQRKLIKKKRKWCEEELHRVENDDQQIRRLIENYSNILDLKRIRLHMIDELIQETRSKRLRIESQITHPDRRYQDEIPRRRTDEEGREEGKSNVVIRESDENETELSSLKKSSKALKRQKWLLVAGIQTDISELAQCGDRLVELEKKKSSLETEMKQLCELKQTESLS
jgi:chromosome segregation ATPase